MYVSDTAGRSLKRQGLIKVVEKKQTEWGLRSFVSLTPKGKNVLKQDIARKAKARKELNNKLKTKNYKYITLAKVGGYRNIFMYKYKPKGEPSVYFKVQKK